MDSKRLVELLMDVDYVTSKDYTHLWWEEKKSVGVIKNNYNNYSYLYCVKEIKEGKKGVFYIDYNSIWSVFSTENNMSTSQIQRLTESMLGERYNFGDIATFAIGLKYKVALG